MKMLRISVFILLVINITCLYSQEFDVPKNYVLEKVEDFAEYESDVLKGIDWLLKTPVNEQTIKRREMNAFILKWISGSPNVTIEINPKIAKFSKDNNELLMIFMCGWTKHSLETKIYNDKLKSNLNAVQTIIDFYTKNKTFMQKDKNVEKYIKLKGQGKLEEYIKSNI